MPSRWAHAADMLKLVLQILAVSAAILCLAFLVVDARERGIASERASEERQVLLDVAERIESCTNPAGECARRGQGRTAAAVAEIVAAVKEQHLVPDPALRQAVLELCDANNLPCTELRRAA